MCWDWPTPGLQKRGIIQASLSNSRLTFGLDLGRNHPQSHIQGIRPRSYSHTDYLSKSLPLSHMVPTEIIRCIRISIHQANQLYDGDIPALCPDFGSDREQVRNAPLINGCSSPARTRREASIDDIPCIHRTKVLFSTAIYQHDHAGDLCQPLSILLKEMGNSPLNPLKTLNIALCQS